MRNARLAAIAGLVVFVTGTAVNAAQTSLLAELDRHAWTLERTAIRADRDVRYDFRHAPVASCLRKQFCFIAEKADDLQRTIGRKIDPRELRDIEDCLHEIDENLEEALQALEQLRSWSVKCRPVVLRYGSLRLDSCASGATARDLQRLCGRVELLQSTMKCMFETLEKLFCECGITRPHVHGRPHDVPGRRSLEGRPTVPRSSHTPGPPQQSSRQSPHRGRSPHRTMTIPVGGSAGRFQISFMFD